MKKTGILGGSFNPAHAGHVHISKLAIEKLALDELWWIPTRKNPFKDKNIYMDYDVRVAECKKIIGESGFILRQAQDDKNQYDKILVKKYDEIYTIDLVKKLKTEFVDREFVWIMGADNLVRLHEWKDFSELVKIIPFAIFSRETYLKDFEKTEAFKIGKDNMKIFFTENLDISSTKIRNL